MMLTTIPSYSDIDGVGTFAFAGGTLGGVVSTLLPYVFAMAGLGLLVYLIMGGYKLLTSGGNPENLNRGKTMITNAIIGFLIVITSYWLYQILRVVFALPNTG